MTDRFRTVRDILSSSFLGRVLILATGTGLGQVVAVMAAPILTRLYQPADFGTLVAYVSLLSMLISVSSLRYELAIPLPEEDEVAANLLAVASLATIGYGGLLSAGLLIFKDSVWHASLGQAVWLLPLGVMGASIYQVLSYWAIRRGAFSQLSGTKVHQGLAQVTTQLTLGALGFSAAGLVVGDVFGRVAGSGGMARSMWRKDRLLFGHLTLKNMLTAAARYNKFPLISAPSALLNTAGVQLPLLMLASIYGPSVAGWLGLAQRVMGTPMTLVGQAVSQVYVNEASRLASSNPVELHSRYLQTAFRLLLLGVALLLPIAILGPTLFGWVFGQEWTEAGSYVQALSFMLVVQLVVAPLSQTLNVLEKLGLQLGWDLGRLLLVITSLMIARELDWTPLNAVAAYSASMGLAYIILFFIAERAIRGRIHG